MNCIMRKCILEHPYKTVLAFFVLIVIGLGLASAYKSYYNNQNIKLAEKYFELSNSVQNLAVEPNTIEKIVQNIDEIKDNSAYSNMSHLLIAKYYFEKKQYDKSIQHLKFVIKHVANDNMLSLAYVRLVNVYIAKNDFISARNIVFNKSLTSNVAIAPAIYEVQGDMYLAQHEHDKAIDSYQKVTRLDVSDDVKRGVKIKLQLLGVNS
jgi:predicted negative regulator of RcsB-dependent stress response